MAGADILASLPPPEILEERLPITEEQRRAMLELFVERGAGLFGSERMGVQERARLAQLARGFLYEGKGSSRQVRRFPSRKPGRVAEIVRDEVAAGDPTLVWTSFDEEGEILREQLAGVPLALLSGKTPPGERLRMVEGFRSGEIPVLISKPQLIGYGLNFQVCRAMVFSGLDDSFERRYQAIRRAYRYGQTHRVRVHVPYIPELEGMMFDNVAAKDARFEAEAAAQEAAYIEAMRMWRRAA